MNYSQIFLTGATGVLGAHLLKELLENTNATIHCLVRAGSDELARERVLSFLKAYDPELKLRDLFNKRVSVVVGDVVFPNFGLSDKSYAELIEKTDVTLHVAALTNLFINYRRIQPINVGGTENVIKFALETKQKYLCYVSTHTVMGDRAFDKNLAFKETDLDIGQGFEHMTYQKSKFVAENMVRSASRHGLMWNIFRPGQIFGDSRTGYYPQGQTNVSGLFYDIFKTVIETEVALISGTHFDVSPVDYVSRGIMFLGLMRPSYSETYHLTNPDIKRYHEVIRMVSEQGYPMKFVSQEKYKKMLFANELQYKGSVYKSTTISAFKWWYKKEMFDFEDSCITDCSYTQDILKDYGLSCVRIDSDLIAKYTDEAIRWDYFPKRPAMGKSRSSVQRAVKEQEL